MTGLHDIAWIDGYSKAGTATGKLVYAHVGLTLQVQNVFPLMQSGL